MVDSLSIMLKNAHKGRAPQLCISQQVLTISIAHMPGAGEIGVWPGSSEC